MYRGFYANKKNRKTFLPIQNNTMGVLLIKKKKKTVSVLAFQDNTRVF